MFIIWSLSSGSKDLLFNQPFICPTCKNYSSLSAVMTYSYFSLFFIPLFKWNRKYCAVSNCCRHAYEISPDLGKNIRNGVRVILTDTDLGIDHTETSAFCVNCGNAVDSAFDFCPKCGSKL